MTPRTCDPSGMGWEQCTAEGSERSQLVVWTSLSIRDRLQALDELCERSRRLLAWRRRSGLPYFDPATGRLIGPRAADD
jgi:hypothetical protein